MTETNEHETSHNIRLTSAEMATLWTQYQNESLASCVLTYFLHKVEDSEIRPIVELARNQAEKSLKMIADIFIHEKHPIPIGFKQDDVNVDAPRLFSDTFILYYIRQMSIINMAGLGVAIGVAARSDVSHYFRNRIISTTDLHDHTRILMLDKGIYVRPPYISTPERVDFVKDQQFLAGYLGEKRSLTAIEITHLFQNILTNSLGKSLMMGFLQVTNTPEIKVYLRRGKKIAQKHMEIFGKTLIKEDLPAPMSWESHVMDTTVPPFSEKLMLFHISVIGSAGIGNYGAAMAASQRHDLGVLYARLMTESALYAEDGANIMIDQGWMEEPPQADNRKKLIHSK